MFLEFYGLKEQPFGVTADPRFTCPSNSYSKAYNSLSRGLEAGCGLLALIAKPGMGKTTLVFQLLRQLNQTSRPIFLSQTLCDSREFLRYLVHSLGVDTAGLDTVATFERLNQLLVHEREADRRVVVIVDECQNLDSSVLETVRLLSDFETPETKLIQIVLVGQTPLAKNLSSPRLASLRQRISILCRLEPLTREEILRYIDHRLQVAGYAGAPLFTSGALEWILATSEGIPRNINNLCLNALLAGYEAGRKPIDFDIVDKVLTDLDVNPLKLKPAISPQLPPGPQRTPVIRDSGTFRGNLNSKQVSSQEMQEIATKVDEIRPHPVPQLGHTQAPLLPPGSPLPYANVTSRDHPDRKHAKLVDKPEAVTDSPIRKPHVTPPLAPPQKAQSDPCTALGDFRGQEQLDSTIVGNNPVPTDMNSSLRKMSEPVRLQTPAQPMAVISDPEISSPRWRGKTVGALTLGAALTGLFLFSFRVGPRREFPAPRGVGEASVAAPLPSPTASSAPAVSSTPVTRPPATDAAPTRPLLAPMLQGKIVRIVIDPGHGGHDTGTTGPAGLMEKDLCLDLALRLGRIIKQRLPSVEVIFTRTNDTFIPLEERTYIANDIKADLFLSIHANSSPYPAVRGIETYYLDLAGNTEVMELAARENATAQGSDRLERMKKTGLGEEIEQSRMLAEDIQDSLNRFAQRSASGAQNRRVRRAPFVVLAGANMPSVLAEIAFLSNPAEEQLLKKGEYCERLAEGLYQGLATYLQSPNSLTHNPPSTNPVVAPQT